MQNQPVMRVLQEFGGRDLLKLGFDLERRPASSEPGSVGDPEDMRVDRDRWQSEGNVENDVRRLSAYASQLLQRVAIGRHLPVMSFQQLFRHQDQILGLCIEQADRVNVLANPFFTERQHGLGSIRYPEQLASGDIDAHVRCLSRERHRHQQGVRAAPFQFTLRLGIELRQTKEELGRLSFLHSAPTTSRML